MNVEVNCEERADVPVVIVYDESRLGGVATLLPTPLFACSCAYSVRVNSRGSPTTDAGAWRGSAGSAHYRATARGEVLGS